MLADYVYRPQIPRPPTPPTRFHESSARRPSRRVFLGVAQRCLATLTPDTPDTLQRAAAHEAVELVFGRRYPWLDGLSATSFDKGCSAAEAASAADHATYVALQLDWEQRKHEVIIGRTCHRYDKDPDFMRWLDDVPPMRLTYWCQQFCPQRAVDGLDEQREAIAELRPMPACIRWAHCDASTVVELADSQGRTARLVALACQRLVAVHTARYSTDCPRALLLLYKRCKASRRQRSWPAANNDSVDSIRLQLESELDTPAVVNSSLSLLAIETATAEARQTIESVARRIGSLDLLTTEVERLRPRILRADRICLRCYSSLTRAGMMPKPVTWGGSFDEKLLPPFHPACRCFQLAWSTPGVSGYERELSMWACAVHFELGEMNTPFPLGEFLERAWSGGSRSGSAKGTPSRRS